MVYRENPLLALSTLGLPDVLAQVLTEVLTPEEIKELAQLDIFVNGVKSVGENYDRMEAASLRSEASMAQIKHPDLVATMKEHTAKSRARTLEFCKDMLLRHVKIALDYVQSMRESQARMAQIEKELGEKLAKLVRQTAEEIEGSIVSGNKK